MAEKAQVGDLIRVVKVVDGFGYEVGDIGEVIEVYADGSGVDAKFSHDGSIPLDTVEYVIHRKAGEEDETAEPLEYVTISGDLSREETQADRIKRAGTELTELLVRKNHDYGDSFARQYEKYGLMSALIRMDDKMRRLETLLAGTDAQVDESIKDTLLDLAGYALLASVEVSKR